MGLCYQIKMQDDFDWRYSGTTKKKQLNKFIKEFVKVRGFKPELIAEWYGHAIFDLDKTNPVFKEYKDVILSNCDSAVFWAESYHSAKVSELIRELE